MKDYILKRPMLLSAILCVVVSVLGYYFKISILFSSAISVAIFIWLILQNKSVNAKIIAITVIIMTLSLITTVGRADTISNQSGKTAECNFIVTDITYSSANYCRADIEVTESILLPKGTKLSVGYSDVILSLGDRAEGEIKLNNIDKDYRELNYSKEIFLNGNLKEFNIKENSSDIVLKLIGKVRNYISDTLFSNMSYSAASTVGGIVLGEDKYFTEEFGENIKASGVSHVMVVSGMHLSVFVLIATYLIEKVVYNKYLRALLISFTVLFLIAVCGFTASMLRSGITYLLMALALVFDKKGVPENTLGASVTIILIISPFTILNIGFQLSVLATFGILAIALPIINLISKRGIIKNKIFLGVFSAVLTTLSATLLTMPVSVNAFGYVSTVALFSNLLITVAVDIILWIVVLALVINIFFSRAASVLFYICEPVVNFVNSVINSFGSLEFAVLETPKYVALILILLILLCFGVLLACKKRIDVLKLKEIRRKIITEGGSLKKWR